MKARPWKIWNMMERTLASGRCRSRALHISYRLRSRNSNTKYSSSFSRMTSFSLTMLGWLSLRSERTSRSAMHSSHVKNFFFMCLMATTSPVCLCTALCTLP